MPKLDPALAPLGRAAAAALVGLALLAPAGPARAEKPGTPGDVVSDPGATDDGAPDALAQRRRRRRPEPAAPADDAEATETEAEDGEVRGRVDDSGPNLDLSAGSGGAGETAGEGGDREVQPGSGSLRRSNVMEFDARLVRGERAGSGAVVLFDRGQRPLPPLTRRRKRFLDPTLAVVLGPDDRAEATDREVASEDEPDEAAEAPAADAAEARPAEAPEEPRERRRRRRRR